MEINTSNFAANASSLNKSAVGQDILARTLAKVEEGEQKKPVEEPKAPEGPKSSKQGRIDLYA
jgi:hypothetical protein